MALILNGKSWQDKDGFLNPITLGTLTGAFGEERILTLDYSFDQSLNDCEIYFNPALFIDQGIVLEQSQSLPPSTAYWYKVTDATVVGVENTMNLLNSNASERNMSVTFELNADRLSFKIRLTCFLTADILRFLSNENIDNSIRLLGNTKNANELENLEDSIYNFNATKGIGIHTGVKVPELTSLCGKKVRAGTDGVQIDSYIADGELFALRFNARNVIDKIEIFVNGVLTASSGTQAGNNFGGVSGFDGNSGLGYPLGTHPNPPVVPDPNFWYVGSLTTYNNRVSDFLAATGTSITLDNYQQVIWANTQIGDIIQVRVAGTGGSVWDYEIFCPQENATIPGRYDYSDAWINSEFIFLNEGTMTNPVFELSRNSVIETEFATFEDTDVTLRIDHTSAITQAKVWVIDADNTKQSLDFKKSYGYQPTNYFSLTAPVNVGGNTYETNFVIDKTKLNAGGRYFIIAVYYDSVNEYVASYISDAIFVTDVKFLTPTVTGTIYNLIANFFTNYLEVSPLQRLCCEITLDKYTGFDSAFLGGNVKIGGETFTFLGKNNQGSFENANRFVFSDSEGSLIIRFYLRVKEEWQNSEIDILWKLNFNVEYTGIEFPQRLSVTQMEQNKATPNLTEIKLYKDGVELLEEGDTACDANFLRVETIKTAESVNYAQAAIWKDENGNVYEEEAWSPISVFTQASNAFQSDVEIQFDTVLPDNDVNHNISNLVDNGEVGMIGYPPPLPISFIRHPFHSTTKTGRNVVFEAEYDYGAGKTIATVNGFPSSDFLFRVGTDTTPLNANDNAWAAFSDLTFAAFAALSISAGSRIMVRYIGTQDPETEQLNIVGYLEMRFSETPVNPKILNLPIEKNIAAGDIMFFTGLNVNFTSATYSFGVANPYSAKRTFTAVADNEDLVTYTSGIGNGNSPNNNFVPHLYFERTSTTAFTVNLLLDQIELVNVEIGNPAIPLYNFAYPILGNGQNPLCWRNDWVNDALQITDAEVKNAINFSTIPNNSYLIYSFTVRFDGSLPLDKRILSLGKGSNAAMEISANGSLNLISDITGSPKLHSIRPSIAPVTPNNKVFTLTACIKKIGNTIDVETTFDVEDSFFVYEGDFIPATLFSQNMTSPFGNYSTGTLLIAQTSLAGLRVLGYAAIRAINNFGFSVLTNPISLKDCKKYALRENIRKQYEWDFISYSSPNTFNGVGTLSSASVTALNHSGILSNLFIP